MNAATTYAIYTFIIAAMGIAIVFTVAGLLADYVLPRIPALRRWVDGMDLFPGDNAATGTDPTRKD